MMIKEAINKIVRDKDLTESEMETTMLGILAGDTTPSQAGAFLSALTEKMANVLKKLGAREAFVVYGEGTYDEISICGPTTVSHLINNGVESYQLDPRDYGFKTSPVEALYGGGAQDNARIINEIVNGSPGPKRDMVVLNAAAAFVAAGLDKDFKGGIQRAVEVIDSGKAREKLDALVKFTADCSYFTRN